MKRMSIIIVLMLIWCLVAVGCAIYKVPFDIYGKYWWMVSIVLLGLEWYEVYKVRKVKKK